MAPTCYAFSPKDQVSNDALDSDADPAGKTACVTLQASETNRTVDAGLYVPPTAQLGDRVWEDKNANGIQDTGEPGIAGATVELYACNGSVLASTTTDSDGLYKFMNLAAGSYYVVFTKPAGFAIASSPNIGDDGADSDADPATGKTACVTLQFGESNLTVDAGFYKPPLLGDRVWEDKNGNGIQDCSSVSAPTSDSQKWPLPLSPDQCEEPGIPNVPVSLVDCTNGSTVMGPVYTRTRTAFTCSRT